MQMISHLSDVDLEVEGTLKARFRRNLGQSQRLHSTQHYQEKVVAGSQSYVHRAPRSFPRRTIQLEAHQTPDPLILQELQRINPDRYCTQGHVLQEKGLL